MKKFVTFEGCEGAGKSTQIKILHKHLLEKGVDVCVTREPGGSRIAEKIRDIILDKDNLDLMPKTELLLYLSARAQHIEEVIKPALQKGQVVLCDRYIDSTFAYQGVARKMGELVNELNHLTVGDFVPELTVFLDCPPKVAFARKGGFDEDDRMEREGLAFHEEVYKGYKQIASKEPQRFVCVDATGTKTDTQGKIIALLTQRGII